MMRAKQAADITRELRELLIEERDLLKSGHAAETIELAGRKRELIETLEPLMNSWAAQHVPPAQFKAVAEIQTLAKENALHFNSVRNGLRSLIERLDSHSENSKIGAYDQYGNQMKFTRSEGGYKKSV